MRPLRFQSGVYGVRGRGLLGWRLAAGPAPDPTHCPDPAPTRVAGGFAGAGTRTPGPPTGCTRAATSSGTSPAARTSTEGQGGPGPGRLGPGRLLGRAPRGSPTLRSAARAVLRTVFRERGAPGRAPAPVTADRRTVALARTLHKAARGVALFSSRSEKEGPSTPCGDRVLGPGGRQRPRWACP